MQPRKYSEAQIRAALADVSRLGTFAAASRYNGIPQSTLKDWYTEDWTSERKQPEKEEKKAVDPIDAFRANTATSTLKAENAELVRRLIEAEERFKFASAISAPPIALPRITTRFGNKRREGMAVALASDWHVEETVYSDAVAGRNEYNLTIAQHRAERFFDGVEWLTQFNRAAWEVHDLLLWLGGDLMTGYIHPELEESNSLSPVETVIWLRGVIGNGIRQLLAMNGLDRLIVVCNYGNHGRTGIKKRIKTGAKNSFEWMLYHVLKGDFADEPRVEFVIPTGAHAYVEAYDFTLHFHHGDEVKYFGGVGGMHIPLGKRAPKWEAVRDSDLHHIGHFHQLTDVGHTVVNGSLIGYTEYAMSIGAEFEEPKQVFYLLDSKRGKTNLSPIWVDGEPINERIVR